MKITYKWVEGFGKKYIVSNFGQVISLKRKKPIIMKPGLNRGYFITSLSNNGKRKTFYVHSLVGNAFVGKRINGLTFDHIDICKANNRADNLRLATYSEQNINRNTRRNNTTGEKYIYIRNKKNNKYYVISITRNNKSVVYKWFSVKKYTMADAIKYRDEQLKLLSRI